MGRPSFDKSTGERVGAVIKGRREKLRLSLSAFAGKAGLDVSQASKIERGLCGTDLAGWRRIALALDMSPAAFVARVFPKQGGRAA